MSLRIETITIDADDPGRLAAWWAELLGWDAETDADGDHVVHPPGGDGPVLLFLGVPEPKAVKNRLHLDLRPDDQQAEVERALAAGATRVDIGQEGDPNVTWVVLADPEGNEFCILRSG